MPASRAGLVSRNLKKSKVAATLVVSTKARKYVNVKALLLSLIIVINSREMRESHCVTHSSIMADAYLLRSLAAAKITGFCASLCVITEFENSSKKSHFTPLRAKRAKLSLDFDY